MNSPVATAATVPPSRQIPVIIEDEAVSLKITKRTDSATEEVIDTSLVMVENSTTSTAPGTEDMYR